MKQADIQGILHLLQGHSQIFWFMSAVHVISVIPSNNPPNGSMLRPSASISRITEHYKFRMRHFRLFSSDRLLRFFVL